MGIRESRGLERNCEPPVATAHEEKTLTMKFNSMLQRIGSLVVMLILCAAAWAQDTASITGTVTDATGAAVPNAQVALKNSEHGINRAGTSNGSGDFLFSSLPIGSYDLTVSAEGFKKYEARGII